MSNPEKSNNIMDQLKRIAFTLLLALAVFPLSAQQDKVVDSEAYLHEYLKENNPSFPKVCEKTVFNYVKKIRKRYDIPARV